MANQELGVLIHQLPDTLITEAIKVLEKKARVSERTFVLVRKKLHGLEIFFDSNENCFKTLSMCYLVVRSVRYSIYPVLTYLTVLNVGPNFNDQRLLNLRMEPLGRVLSVYPERNQMDRTLTGNYRVVIGHPEICEWIKPCIFPLRLPGSDVECPLTFFCRFCRENGHSLNECSANFQRNFRAAGGEPSFDEGSFSSKGFSKGLEGTSEDKYKIPLTYTRSAIIRCDKKCSKKNDKAHSNGNRLTNHKTNQIRKEVGSSDIQLKELSKKSGMEIKRKVTTLSETVRLAKSHQQTNPSKKNIATIKTNSGIRDCIPLITKKGKITMPSFEMDKSDKLSASKIIIKPNSCNQLEPLTTRIATTPSGTSTKLQATLKRKKNVHKTDSLKNQEIPIKKTREKVKENESQQKVVPYKSDSYSNSMDPNFQGHLRKQEHNITSLSCNTTPTSTCNPKSVLVTNDRIKKEPRDFSDEQNEMSNKISKNIDLKKDCHKLNLPTELVKKEHEEISEAIGEPSYKIDFKPPSGSKLFIPYYEHYLNKQPISQRLISKPPVQKTLENSSTSFAKSTLDTTLYKKSTSKLEAKCSSSSNSTKNFQCAPSEKKRDRPSYGPTLPTLGVTAAIRASKGVLEPCEMKAFLLHVRGRNHVRKVARHFSPDVNQLLEQLKTVVYMYYRGTIVSSKDQREIERIGQLIKRIISHNNCRVCNE